MKRKWKAVTAGALVVAVLAGIAVTAFSSDTPKISESIHNENIIDAGTADNDVSEKEYTLLLENDRLQFWLNENTTEFKVVNKENGSAWYSSNPNRADGSPEAAPVHLSYLNSQGGLEDTDVMTGSVVDGKYKVEPSDEKVTVRYSVGDFSELARIPYALTEARFREVKDALTDEFEQMKLIDLYYLTDIDVIEDADFRKKRLQEYPKLAEQKLYLIRDSVKEDPLAKKDVEAIFADAGYTEEDYKADSAYFSADNAAKASAGFNLAVEYALQNDSLNIRVPYDGIEMSSEFPLTSLAVAPYFGSPVFGEEGWFLLPDGSGSLMNFYNGKSNQIYRTTVYGQEKTQAGKENLDYDAGASLPVFGIQNGGHGVLCEIAEGDAVSQIVAYAGDNADAAYAHAVFNLRSTYKQTTATGKKESYVVIQKQRYTGDVSLQYHFISGENARLADMAAIVRESIFANDATVAAGSLPVMLEQIGMVTRQNQFLGVAYDQKVALTDFEQSLAITDAFSQSGIENLSVVFRGWFGDGLEHAFLSKTVSASKRLGSGKKLRELLDGMRAKGVPFYLDADVQYTAKDGAFDGFGKYSDAAAMLDQSTGKVYPYDRASFMRRTSRYAYINNADAQLRAVNALKSSVEKYDAKEISLRTVGAELSADYGSATVDRQQMADRVSAYLQELCESGYRITTQGANAYALPYTVNALNVPVESSGFDMTDLSVPFLQMVLSGKVNYYAPSLNLAGDVQNALLQAVSSGSGLSCVVTAQNSDRLAGSSRSDLYATDFAYWKQTLPKQIAETQSRLASVAGRQITDYEKLAEGVYKTTYENGRYVIVNYNGDAFRYEGVTVPPKDFALGGAE